MENKKKILPFIVGGAVVLLLVIGVVVFAMRETIGNTIARMTKSPDDYFRYVMDKQLDDAEKYLDVYEDTVAEALKMKSMSVKGEMRLELSDDVLELAEDELIPLMFSSSGYGVSPDVRLDAYSDIAIAFQLDRADGMISAMEALQLKDKDYLLTIEEMYDPDESVVYLRVPQLNEEYLKIEMEQMLEEDELEVFQKTMEQIGNVQTSMPDMETIKTIYRRYCELILDQIRDVEVSKDKVDVNGMEQSFTLLTFELDEDTQRTIAEEVLTTMRDDDDLEDFFYDFFKNSGMEDQAEDMWDDMVEDIDRQLDALDDTEITGEPTITVYVDGKGKIHGLMIEQDKDVLMAAYALKGSKLSVEAYGAEGKDDLFRVSGEGKLGSKGYNMDCVLEVPDEDLEIEFGLEDVGLTSGALRVNLEPFFEELEGAAVSDVEKEFVDVLNGNLLYSWKSEKKTGTSKIALVDDDDEAIIGLSFSSEVSEAEAIEFPANRDVVKVGSSLELLPYLQDCDMDELISILETLGVPDDVTSSLSQQLDMLTY